MHIYSSRVIQNKKGGNQHRIPYTMTVEYTHPPTDNVPARYRVDPLLEVRDKAAEVKTVEEGIALYMEAFRTKFEYPLAAQRREWNLARFVEFLKSREHSLRLDELIVTDGQDFIEQVVGTRTGLPLSPGKKKQYRSTLRSFSRFLHKSRILTENLFFALRIK